MENKILSKFEKKQIADNLVIEEKYDQAIEIYSLLLKNEEDTSFNFNVRSNRSLCWLKLKKYELALKDSIKCTKIKPNSGKSWGRLGASLYGLNKLEDAKIAYNKANNLEPNEIYIEAIKNITAEINENKKISKLNDSETESESDNETTENEETKNEINQYLNNGLLNEMLNSLMNNSTIIEKISEPKFQEKLIEYQKNNFNPIELLKDSDMQFIMNEIMNNMNNIKKN